MYTELPHVVKSGFLTFECIRYVFICWNAYPDVVRQDLSDRMQNVEGGRT